MPYELVTPEVDESIGENETDREQRDKNWKDEADSGYLDSFRKLKAEMDFTRKEYQDQMNSLPARKAQLSKELKKAWFNVALYLFIIPIGLWVLTDLFMNWGASSGGAATVYVILKILLFPGLFASIFIALPPTIRTLINVQRRYNVFNNANAHAAYRARYDIVSFPEEEHFLRQMLMKYENFDERIQTEGLDQPGGGDPQASVDERTERQAAILDEMQSLTIFKEYRARTNINRLEGDLKWVLLGLGIGVFISLGGFMIVM